MKREISAAMLAIMLSTAGQWGFAADNAACKLVTKAEMQAIMGELKGEMQCGSGLRPGEVTCNFDNMAGAWVKLRLYKQNADQWSLLKQLLPNPRTAIPGLGQEAFSTKVGSDSQVYVRKGDTILEVDSSGGLKFATETAKKAAVRLK